MTCGFGSYSLTTINVLTAHKIKKIKIMPTLLKVVTQPLVLWEELVAGRQWTTTLYKKSNFNNDTLLFCVESPYLSHLLKVDQ